MKKRVAVTFKNNELYYIGEDKDGCYKLTKNVKEAIDFKYSFLFFSKNIFEVGIKNKLGLKSIAWISGHKSAIDSLLG